MLMMCTIQSCDDPTTTAVSISPQCALRPDGLDETTTMMALKDADEEPSIHTTKLSGTRASVTSFTDSIESFISGGFSSHDEDDFDFAYDLSEEKPSVIVLAAAPVVPVRKSQDSRTAKKDKLMAALRDLDERIENCKTELEFRKMAGAALQANNAAEMQDLQQLVEATSQTLHKAVGPGMERASSLHNYVSHIRTATKGTGQTTGTSYVVTMEAQVCQSIHRMCILEKQRDLASLHAKRLVEWMRDESRSMTQERSKVEADLLSRVFEMNCETRTTTDKYKAILAKQESAIETLESKVWEAEFNRGNHDWMRQQLEDDQGRTIRKSMVGRTQRRASIGYTDAILRSSVATMKMQRRGSMNSPHSHNDSVMTKLESAISSMMQQSQEPGGTNRKEGRENGDQVAIEIVVEPTPTLFQAFRRRASIY